jgi:uncharacterized membrane protein
MIFLFALIGVIVGISAQGSFLGSAVLGGAIGVLAGWLVTLRQRLDEIDRRTAGPDSKVLRVDAARQRHAETTIAEEAEPLPDEAAGEPVPAQVLQRPPSGRESFTAEEKPQTRPPASPSAREHEPARMTAPPPEVEAPEPPVSAYAGLLIERLTVAAKRWLTEGNVPVKVGVIVSLFGLAFLILEAVERGWLVFPIELRLFSVALFGLALLVIGWRLRSRRPVYALSLQGGGVATIYLTTYAAFAIYGLLPTLVALVLLVFVTVSAGALAVLQNGRSLAVLAIAGGFIAPVITSSGEGSHVVLFSYYAVLNTAVFGIAWFKAWRVLNLLGFLFTFVIATLWGYLAYNPSDFATTEPFLVLFVLMYTIVPILYASQEVPNLKGWVDGTLVFGTPMVGFGLQTQLVGDSEYGLAISAVALSGVYVLIATHLFRRKSPELRVLTESFWSLSIVFLAIAVPLALNARWTSVAWSLQGAAMIWLGLRQDRKLALAAGVFLQLGAAVAYSLQPVLPEGEMAVLNGHFLGGLWIAAAGLFSAWIFDRMAANEETFAVTGAWALLVWGAAWWFLTGLNEIERFLSPDVRPSASLGFAAATVWAALLPGSKLKWPRLDFVGLLIVPAMAFAFLYGLAEQSHLLERFGWLAWPFAFATHFGFLRLREERLATLAALVHGMGYWLLIGVLVSESYWWVDRWSDGIWAVAASVAFASGLVFATFGTRLRMVWPVMIWWRTYLLLGAGVSVALLAFTLFVLNLTSSGDPAPLIYLPLLNPLELAIALAALVVYAWYAVAREYSPVDRLLSAESMVLPVLLGLLFLTMIVARTVHHWGGVPFDPANLAASNVLQASLSIVWGSAALTGMVLGARSGRRMIWMAGAGLMAVVVAKLFVVELGNTGTVTRVVSFLGVGILLLVVGYFAPVPPRDGEKESEG